MFAGSAGPMGSMSAMTNTTPARQALPELEQATLRYYTREALGIDNTGAPLGGVKVFLRLAMLFMSA
jgi:hypothetical protein